MNGDPLLDVENSDKTGPCRLVRSMFAVNSQRPLLWPVVGLEGGVPRRHHGSNRECQFGRKPNNALGVPQFGPVSNRRSSLFLLTDLPKGVILGCLEASNAASQFSMSVSWRESHSCRVTASGMDSCVQRAQLQAVKGSQEIKVFKTAKEGSTIAATCATRPDSRNRLGAGPYKTQNASCADGTRGHVIATG